MRNQEGRKEKRARKLCVDIGKREYNKKRAVKKRKDENGNSRTRNMKISPPFDTEKTTNIATGRDDFASTISRY